LPSISLSNAAVGVVGDAVGDALVADERAFVDEHPASTATAPTSPPESSALRLGHTARFIEFLHYRSNLHPCLEQVDATAK